MIQVYDGDGVEHLGPELSEYERQAVLDAMPLLAIGSRPHAMLRLMHEGKISLRAAGQLAEILREIMNTTQVHLDLDQHRRLAVVINVAERLAALAPQARSGNMGPR